MNNILNTLNNENFDLSLLINEDLVNKNPYGFNHSESHKNNLLLDPININNVNILELDRSIYPSINTKNNNLNSLLNFSSKKDPITGINIEYFNQNSVEILEELTSFQSSNSYETIENKGNTHLSKDGDGFGYIKNSREYISIKSFSSQSGYGQRWGNNTWSDWELVGAEKVFNKNSTIWKNLSGEFWVANHDSDWAYEANSGSHRSGEQLLLSEKQFQQDLNSDGVIGGNLYTTTEIKGNVSLAKDINSNAFIKTSDSSSYIPLTNADGNAMGDSTRSGWSLVGAETINATNKTVWKSTANTFWLDIHNSSWVLSSQQGYITGSELLSTETDFQQDFNSDGVIGADLSSIEIKGDYTLALDQDKNAYVKSKDTSNYISIKGNGANWGNKTWTNWEIIGVESIQGIKTTAWKNNNDQYWFAEHDSDWNYDNGSGKFLSGSALKLKETQFQQDLNNDGVIDNQFEFYEQKGNVSLAKDVSGNGFIKTSDSSSYVEITGTDGKPRGDNTWSGWSLVGAETINGTNKTIWKSIYNNFWLAKHDSSWVLTSAEGYPTGAELLRSETDFQQDLNGDDVIGLQYSVTENKGNIVLSKDANGNGYIQTSSSDSYHAIKGTDGSLRGDNTWDGWTIVGAETIKGINKTVWKSTANTFWIANHNSSWAIISSEEGTKTATEIADIETNYQQDFNNDRHIGNIKYTSIETEGNITLVKNPSGNGFVKAYNSSSYIPLTNADGNAMGDSTRSGWSLVGAETINATNKTVWKSTANTFWLDIHNSSWVLSSQQGYITGSELLSTETDFQQDFNSDGVIGIQYTVTENKGKILLVKDSDGNGFIKAYNSNSYIALTSTDGKARGDNTWSGWSLVGAETINGTNKTIWKSTANTFWLAKHDSSWVLTSDEGYPTGSELLSTETDFQQDFNEDSVIGLQYSVTENKGNIILSKDSNGNGYIQTSALDSYQSIKDIDGSLRGDNTWSGWNLVGAEIIKGVNKTVWKSTANTFWIANHNSSWAIISSEEGTKTATEIADIEINYQQDFNGDETIGSISKTSTETKGNISLAKDVHGNGFVKASGSNSYIAITGTDGKARGDNTWSGWRLVGAETINNTNKTIWKSKANTFWTANHNSSWVLISAEEGTKALSEIEEKETQFIQDFNSDGIIGTAKKYIESESLGTISLFTDQNKYSYIQEYGLNIKIAVKNHLGQSLKEVETNNGSQRTIIAAETITGINKILFKESSGYFIADFDSNWKEKSDSYQKIKLSEIIKRETEFEEDLNSDGSIGNLVYTLIESKGNVLLFKDSNNYAYTKASDSDTYIAIKNTNGDQWGDNTWDSWKIAGAENINGINKTVWKKSSNSFWIASHNTDWNCIENTGINYNEKAIMAMESSFQQDLNKDNIIGTKSLPGIKIDGILDDSIKTDIATYLSDDIFSHNELKSILKNAASNGITETEFNDLKLISTSLNNYLSNSTSSYLNYIYSSVVNGNNANQWWTNGSSTRTSLGDLKIDSSENQVNRLVEKWFKGADLPTNYIGGDSAGGYGGKSFNYGNLTGDLFVNGIDLDDINQGEAGTCYLISGIICSANDSESLIRSMFCDNGDGTYGVRFYGDDLSEIWVTVNNKIPLAYSSYIRLAGNKDYSLSGEKWVSLLEKAYAQANEIGLFKRYGDRASRNSYWGVEGGWGTSLSHLSGKELKGTISVQYTCNGNLSEWNKWKNIISSEIINSNSVYLGSFGTTYGDNGKKNFIPRHAYSITAYNASTDLFTIYNPHGVENSSSQHNHSFQTSWETIFKLNAWLYWT